MGCTPMPSGFKSNFPSSYLKLSESSLIFVWKKSPILNTQIGGEPNTLFVTSLKSSLTSPSNDSLTVGMVSPGLIHCCKNVNLEFKPSGVIE